MAKLGYGWKDAILIVTYFAYDYPFIYYSVTYFAYDYLFKYYSLSF